jgi:hypothetical protein
VSARRVAVAAVVAAALPTAGCGSPPGGDPGGRLLRELAADPGFTSLPPAATAVSVTRTAARYRNPDFTTGGWDGPSVVVAFSSASAPAAVYRFVARAATGAGWHATASGAIGLTDRWAKTYPDGGRATLLLVSLVPHAYRLSGAIGPKADGPGSQ